jgi:hypothetical protein
LRSLRYSTGVFPSRVPAGEARAAFTLDVKRAAG